MDYYKIKTAGTIEIPLDNMEVKNQEKQDEDYVHIFQNSANIIQDIRQQKSSFLPGIITFKCRWIKGHQREKRGKWTAGGENRTRKWVY